jgi:hypothetical protein
MGKIMVTTGFTNSIQPRSNRLPFPHSAATTEEAVKYLHLATKFRFRGLPGSIGTL